MMENSAISLNTKKRPVGVTAFGWIDIGVGVIILGATLFTKVFGSAKDIEEIFGSHPLSLFVLSGCAIIFAAYFLLKLKNWARIYHLIASWISLFIGLFLIFFATSITMVSLILPIYNGVFIYYFLRPSIREQFEEGQNDILWAFGLFLLFFITTFILGLAK